MIQVHRPYDEVRRNVIDSLERCDEPEYGIFDQLDTKPKVLGYLKKYIDEFRTSSYKTAIENSLVAWDCNVLETGWNTGFIMRENQKIFPQCPLRIFDWGSGPATATACFLDHYLNEQIEVDSVFLTDVGNAATKIGHEILQQMTSGELEIREVNESLVNLNYESFSGLNPGGNYIHVHLFFFCVDLFWSWDIERVVRFISKNLRTSQNNYVSVTAPSSKTPYRGEGVPIDLPETIRNMAEIFPRSWNFCGYTCDGRGTMRIV